LPLTQLDLAGLSDLSASVDLSSLDSLLAVGLPCLLALLALPVCLARAAMLGLDCIAVRSQVEQQQIYYCTYSGYCIDYLDSYTKPYCKQRKKVGRIVYKINELHLPKC
jgi:hypothetical protein